ncbi:MerR family transcriptional regulator [Patescibacteria group bacterium]|nr:MerR family transcriptional regulator [Patescibacteria group bacterium]MBP9710518.1 MerR family transcriptional regulator [Patescibacteria group bacterium]
MSYTVHHLAKLASISVRTLHYYDEIGLLTPSSIAKNGYRHYEDKELVRLQQILFFRELDFPLEEIKQMLDRPTFHIIEALRDQKKLMQLKRKRMDGLIQSIEKTIMTMQTNTPLQDEELYNAFKDDDVKQYQNEVKQRWGNTDAYKQSMARVSKMTKQDMEKMKADGKAFTQKLADAMDKTPGHPEVQALMTEHYKGIQFFYECPLTMYRNLGQMYVDDPRFTAYYDKFRPGLAVFVRDAIAHYCDKREK